MSMQGIEGRAGTLLHGMTFSSTECQIEWFSNDHAKQPPPAKFLTQMKSIKVSKKCQMWGQFSELSRTTHSQNPRWKVSLPVIGGGFIYVLFKLWNSQTQLSFSSQSSLTKLLSMVWTKYWNGLFHELSICNNSVALMRFEMQEQVLNLKMALESIWIACNKADTHSWSTRTCDNKFKLMKLLSS